MATFRPNKVLAALPDPPAPDSVYYVRTGAGFDTYVTDGNAIAYKANLGGVAAMSVRTVTGDTTLADADAGNVVMVVSASPATVTVPAGLSADAVVVMQGGDGAVTVAKDTGVTLHTPNGAATTGLGDARAVVNLATDEWTVL